MSDSKRQDMWKKGNVHIDSIEKPSKPPSKTYKDMCVDMWEQVHPNKDRYRKRTHHK